MKRIFLLLMLCIGILSNLMCQCYCEDCPQPIIFGSPSTVSLNVSGISNNILGQNGQSVLNVGVHFSHDDAQEISFRLVAPNGSFVDLTIGEGIGFGQFNYFDINFVQCSGVADPDCDNNSTWTSTDYWNGGPYTGDYFPESGCLEDFTGDVNGTWTIEIDDVYLFENGALYCFDITFADDGGALCNFSGCNDPICLAQGGLTMEPTILEAPEGDPSLLIDYTLTYGYCEFENPSPEYIYIYVIFSNSGGLIIEIQQGTVDLTAYPEGIFVVQGYSILAIDLPIVEGLDFATSTITDIYDLIVAGTICADFTPNAGLVFISNCTIDFSGSLEFDQITAEAGDPALDPDWEITWTPAAPDPSGWGLYYVVYDQITGVIINYIAFDDFIWASAGDYNVSILVYNLNDSNEIPPLNGISTYDDLLDAINNEDICGITFGNNQLFISEPCTIDANGILEQEDITAPQNSPLLDPDWDITFTGVPPDPAIYGFYFVVVNADTDQLVAFYTSDNFTLLLEGNYYVTVVYYLLNDQQVLPPPNGVNTFADLVNLINNNEICAQYFGYNLLFITPQCAADAGSFAVVNIEGCQGSDELILDLTPDYPGSGPDITEYGYTYVVSENGLIIDISNSQDFTLYDEGQYEICGLSYLLIDESILPNPNGIFSIADIQMDIDNVIYCADLTEDCITLTISESPMPIFTGPTTVCAFEEVEYVIENFSGDNNDYLFVINQGGFDQFINDEMGTLSVIWNSGPGNICVIENQNGCEEEVCISIDVLTQPQIQIDGPVFFCPGEEYTYTITPIPDANESYDFSVTDGMIVNQTDNTVVVIWDGINNAVLNVTLITESCTFIPIGFQALPLPQADFPTVNIPTSSCLNTGLTIPDIDDPNITTWTWSATNADINIVNDFVNFTWQSIGPAEICLEAELGCGVVQMCYDVEVLPFPEPIIDAELNFCSLTFTLSAIPSIGNSWLWTSPGSGNSVTYSDQTNFATEVTVDAPGTYTFILQEFSNDCSGSTETTVTVTDGLTIDDPFFLCDDTGNYIVSFDINSGISPYTINGNLITGNMFSSMDIFSGEPYSFFVVDSEGCSVIVEGSFDCPCISDAGTMSTTPIALCISDGSSGQGIHNNDAVLDGNDNGQYILHTGNGPLLGNIIGVNDSGEFIFDPNTMLPGQVYYISYVVGNNDNGTVDLTDLCLSVATGQTIIFYNDPIINAGADDTTCELTYNLSNSAMSIEGSWSIVSQPAGAMVDILIISGDAIAVVNITGTYVFELVGSENGCSTSDEVQITFLDQPLATNLTTLCDGNFYTVEFTINGGIAPFMVNGELVTGDFYTSNPIGSGEVYEFTISDAAGCISEIIQGVEVCNCVTDAGTMSTEEITICAIDGTLISSTFNNDATFDSDDGGMYILHTSSSNVLGTIIDSGEDGEFTYDSSYGSGITLYISYIVGDNVTGSIDFMDECLSISIGQPVMILPLIKVNAGMYFEQCDFSFELSAQDMGFAGFWTAINSPQDALVSFSNASDASSNFETDLPGSYSLSWTASNAQCVVADTISFELDSLFVLVNSTVICDSALEFYTLDIEIAGGVSPYLLNGEEVGNTFTSPSIVSGQAYSFSILDDRGCELLVEGIANCECSNAVGTMAQDTLKGCLTDTLFAIYNEDAILDDNDVEFFVLHTTADNTLGAVLAISTNPSVVFLPGMIPGNVYYLSHILGDEAGGGLDYTDPCLQISIGQPIIFSGPPEVDAGADQELCDFTTNLVGLSNAENIQWSVLQMPFGASIDFDDKDLNSDLEVSRQGEYIFELEADNGFCIVYDTISVTIIDGISTIDFDLICTSEGYIVTFTIVGGSGVYFADGVPLDSNYYESELYDSGSQFAVVISDDGICEDRQIGGLFFCLCYNDAGSMVDDSFNLCTDEVIDFESLSNKDYVLDEDDNIYYVVHTLPSIAVGDIIRIFNSSDDLNIGFGDLPFVVGVTYYVSVVIANEGALEGAIDDPCIAAVEVGVPITWKEVGLFSYSEDRVACKGEVIFIDILFNGDLPTEISVFDDLGFSESFLIDENNFSFEYEVLGASILSLDIAGETDCLGIEDGELTVSIEVLETAENLEELNVCNAVAFGSIINLQDLIISGYEEGQWIFDGNEIEGIIDFDGFAEGMYTLEYVIELETCGLSNSYLTNIIVEACDCPIFDYESKDVTCFGEANGSISVLVSEDIDISEFVLTLNQEEINDFSINDLSAGFYTIEISDGTNCFEFFDIEITEPSPIQISLGEDFETQIDDPVAIEAITNLLAQDIEGVTWASLSGIFDDNDLVLNTSFKNDDEITIIILDENGCEGTDEIKISVTSKEYILPNVINRNSVSGNNIFKIYNSDSIEEVINLSIYDRWGNIMYTADNVAPRSDRASWDGTFGGVPVLPGVYVYKLHILVAGQEEVLYGDLTVL